MRTKISRSETKWNMRNIKFEKALDCELSTNFLYSIENGMIMILENKNVFPVPLKMALLIKKDFSESY